MASGSVEREERAPSLGSFLGAAGLASWSWALAFTAVLTALGIARLQLGMAGTEGLGGVEQSLYLLWSRGPGAVSTLTGGPVLTQGAPLGLFLLAPVLGLGGVGALLFLQALALGTGFVILRRLGRVWGVPDATARLLGLGYLLSPTVWGTALADFHPVSLVVPVLLGLVWAAASERRGWFRVLLAGTVAFAAAAPWLLAGTAAVMAVHRKAGPALEALAAAVLAVLLDLALWGHGGALLLQRTWLGAYGPGLRTAGQVLASHPALWLAWARSLRDWEYLVWMAGPVAVPLLAGWLRGRVSAWLLVGALALEAVLLASSPAATSPFLAFSLPAVAFLYAGSLSMLRGLEPGRAAPVLGGLAAFLFLGVFGYHQRQTVWSRRPPAGTVLGAAAAVVPARAPVLTQVFLTPFLAARSRIWLPAGAPAVLPAGSYLVLEPGYSAGLDPAAAVTAWAARAAASGAAVVFRQEGLVVYRTTRPLSRPS